MFIVNLTMKIKIFLYNYNDKYIVRSYRFIAKKKKGHKIIKDNLTLPYPTLHDLSQAILT